MQFRLRTLPIALAIGPPMLAGAWLAYSEHLRRQEHLRQEYFRLMMTVSLPLILLEVEEFPVGIEHSKP